MGWFTWRLRRPASGILVSFYDDLSILEVVTRVAQKPKTHFGEREGRGGGVIDRRLGRDFTALGEVPKEGCAIRRCHG